MTSPGPRDLSGFPKSLQDRYRPVARLGAGSFGSVFEALDKTLDRPVAIKILHGEIEKVDARRFVREAGTLATLRHPSLVEVYDFGEAPEGPYLVLELLRGIPLKLVPPKSSALDLLLPIGAALEVVHSAGLVHRDVKLANILRTEDGRTVLVDFGLVHDPRRTRMTRLGQVVGSFLHLPPEALKGTPPTAASDWYAWGVCLYLLQEGKPPFDIDEINDWLTEDAFPGLTFRNTNPDSPEARLLRRLLSADPTTRPTSVEEVEAALQRSPQTPTRTSSASVSSGPVGDPRHSLPPPTEADRRSRRGPVLRGFALLLLGLFGLWFVWHEASPLAPKPLPQSSAPDVVALRRDLANRLAAIPAHPDDLVAPGRKSMGRIDDHAAVVFREFEQALVAPRLEKVLQAVEAWLPLASSDERTRLFTQELIPTLAHLRADINLIVCRLFNANTYATTSTGPAPAVDKPFLEARLGEIRAAAAVGLERLRPLLDDDLGLQVQARLQNLGLREERDPLVARLLDQAQAAANPADRTANLLAAMYAAPETSIYETTIQCATWDRLLAATVESLAATATEPASAPRTELAGLGLRKMLHARLRCRYDETFLGEKTVVNLTRHVLESLEDDPPVTLYTLEMIDVFLSYSYVASLKFQTKYQRQIDALGKARLGLRKRFGHPAGQAQSVFDQFTR